MWYILGNSCEKDLDSNKEIALLNWDERLWLKNPTVENGNEAWKVQVELLAKKFAQMIIKRACFQ